MLVSVSESKQVAKLQDAFVKSLVSEQHEIRFVSLGHQGTSSSIPSKVYYFQRLNFWFSTQEDHNRFWNAFGLGDPSLRKNLDIICEINFPFEEIDRRIAGVFAIDGKKTLVLHRGKIGGGRKGIGKSHFRDNYFGKWLQADDGNQSSEMALVGDMNQPMFPKQILTFVQEVYRIKSLSNIGVTDGMSNEHLFNEEFSGLKKGYSIDYTEPTANHGIIVKALSIALNNLGLTTYNNRFIDLYSLKDSQINTIFEIKTSLSTRDIYSAIGQAMFYSARFAKNAKKVIVLPFYLERDAEDILVNSLNLTVIYYEWEGDNVHFLNLEAKL